MTVHQVDWIWRCNQQIHASVEEYLLLYSVHIGFLHVSVTIVAIFREVHCRGYIVNLLKAMHKCKLLSFKICGLKYI